MRAAVAKGFDAIGFSDHGPITVDCACNMRAEDFPAYREEVRRLQTLFRGKIDVLFGLECDWLKGIQPMGFYDAFETDYRIGSVHFLCFDGEAAAVDFSAESQERMVTSQFNGDWEAFVLDYYRNVEAMTAAGGFEILGHLIQRGRPPVQRRVGGFQPGGRPDSGGGGGQPDCGRGQHRRRRPRLAGFAVSCVLDFKGVPPPSSAGCAEFRRPRTRRSRCVLPSGA